MFAIIALFDQKTEMQILKSWTNLKDNNLDDSMIRIQGNRPHISLALFQGVERTMFLDAFREFVGTVEPFSIQFDSVGVFPMTNTVFLTPLPSKHFLHVHEKLYQALQVFSDKADQYYKKEKWMPHCSLAISLPAQKVMDVFANAIQGFQPIYGRVERIALIEVFFSDQGINRVEEIKVV
ncbi:2'-5' RNA ligase family protein [Gottschalkiaceae bacterium SANA]|nr:2'-5' RNA ligase family protein [Gottschalkiaceae bacterium SANA]